MYIIEIILNGKTFTKRTKDLAKAILSLKPELVLTESYIRVKKNKFVSERKLTAKQTRFLFNDEDYRNIFINNLLVD